MPEKHLTQGYVSTKHVDNYSDHSDKSNFKM